MTKQDESQTQVTKFIQSGGGKVVLKCLMESGPAKQDLDFGGGSSGRSLSIQAINKLGKKDPLPKTINEASNLVDFFSLASSTVLSAKGFAKVVTSNRPSHLFMHSYAPNEVCISLHVSFPYPILLHNIILCLVNLEVGGVINGTPSKIAVHSSLHGTPESSVPVTPVYKTDGLKMINLAFCQPVLTQYLVVYLYRPLLSGSVTVSKMEILGTSFGSSAEAIGPSSKSTAVTAQHEKDQHG